VETIYPSDLSDGGVYEQQDGDGPEYIIEGILLDVHNAIW